MTLTERDEELEKKAREWSDGNKHERHSCNGISLHPVREKAFIAGALSEREVAEDRGFMKAVEMLRGEEAAFQGRLSFESRGHLASWWADWLLEQREEEK